MDGHRSLSRAPGFEPPLDGSGAADECRNAPSRQDGSTGRDAAPCLRPPSRRAGAAQMRRSPHDGRSRSSPPNDETASAALQFADRSLRLVLEVLDGRRPLAHVKSVAEPTVAAAVETLARTGGTQRRLGPAVLVSVKATMVGPAAAEVFGGYDRGSRRFAVAARIVVRRGGWRLAALRLR